MAARVVGAAGRVALTVCLLTVLACRRPPADDGVAARFLDALNSHDPDRVLAMMTPDATYRNPGPQGPLAAGDLRAHLALQWQLWNDQIYSVRRMYQLPGAAIVEWQARQTFRNGDPLTLEGVFVLTLRDDRIATVRSYFDSTPLLRFLAPKPN